MEKSSLDIQNANDASNDLIFSFVRFAHLIVRVSVLPQQRTLTTRLLFHAILIASGN